VNKATSSGLTDMAMLLTENLEPLDTISAFCQALSHAKWEILIILAGQGIHHIGRCFEHGLFSFF
jgi:hypothetical protein